MEGEARAARLTPEQLKRAAQNNPVERVWLQSFAPRGLQTIKRGRERKKEKARYPFINYVYKLRVSRFM